MTNNDQQETLSWGARLCPSCNKNEVIRAEKCRSCWAKAYDKKNAAKKAAYMKQYYAKNRPTYLKKAKDQSVAKKAQTQSVLRTMLGAIMEQDQTIKTMTSLSSLSDLFAILKDGIHIHVHVHHEAEKANQLPEPLVKKYIDDLRARKDEIMKEPLTFSKATSIDLPKTNEEKAKDFIQTIIAEKKERAANDLKARSFETKPTIISQTETCDLPGCTIDHTVSSILKSIKVI